MWTLDGKRKQGIPKTTLRRTIMNELNFDIVRLKNEKKCLKKIK
jgi:hypothetical protein